MAFPSASHFFPLAKYGFVVSVCSDAQPTLEVMTYFGVSSAANAVPARKEGNREKISVSANAKEMMRKDRFTKGASSLVAKNQARKEDRCCVQRSSCCQSIASGAGASAPAPGPFHIVYLITRTLLLSLPNTRYPLSETAKPCRV